MKFDPVIVDLGLGNVESLMNALGYLGLSSRLCSNCEDITSATHILLPGVGAFDPAISEISQRGLKEALDDLVINKRVPVLGICLGMQLLFESSEEGGLAGLGYVPGRLERLSSPTNTRLKVPHAGFSPVELEQSSGFFSGMGDQQSFYFTHSYAIRSANLQFETAVCAYGFPFTAAFKHNNIYGAQFHPEKSQAAGLRCLVNFFEGSGRT